MNITNRYTTTKQVSYNTNASNIKVGTVPSVMAQRSIIITGSATDAHSEVITFIRGTPAQLRSLADAALHLASSMEINGEVQL